MEEIFTLVGKVTVDKNGAVQSIEEISDKAEKSGVAFDKLGKLAVTAGKVIATGITAGAGAVSYLTKQAVSAYGEFEQLAGGIKKLYGDAYDSMMTNAIQAYETVGVSANEYIQGVTNFSASLINSLGNDTQTASEMADMAMQDIADNANTFGTYTIGELTDVYKALAKNTFTTLDNLQLGVGGTKEGMQTLIDKANELKKANGEMGNLSINSFADMVTAIHLVQENMNITGTTSREASTTIQGSVNMAKASWQDMLTAFGNTGEDIPTYLDNAEKAIDNFVTTIVGGTTEAGNEVNGIIANILPVAEKAIEGVGTLVEKIAPIISAQLPSLITNLLPNILQTATSLVSSVLTSLPQILNVIVQQLPVIFSTLINETDWGAISTALEECFTSIFQIIGDVATSVLEWFSGDGLSNMVDAGVQWLSGLGSGIEQGIPELLSQALPMILQFSQSILENIPVLIEAGMNFIASIVQGLINSLPDLIAYVPEIITNFADTISQSMEIIIGKGAEIILNIIAGLISAIPDLIANIGDIIQMIISIWQAIQWLDLGKNLINGIKNGISALKDNFTEYVKDIFNKIKEWIKSIFTGVHSDSTSIWGKIFDTIKGVASNIFNSIKSVFTNAYETVKTIFLNIKNAIKNPIETARDLVKSAIDKMKSFFNFSWSLPKLKMPHISITGSFSLVPPSAPHFNIDWYKNGGIMTDPTIFGFNPMTGNLMAGGEAGAEAIAPISDLQDYVRVAVNESNTEMNERLNGILSILSDYLPNMANYSVVLDSGVLVGELAPQMDESLGVIKRRKGR